MKSSSLEHKTVRPGLGLDNYTSFYANPKSAKTTSSKGSRKISKRTLLLGLLIVGILISGFFVLPNTNSNQSSTVVTKNSPSSSQKQPEPVTTPAVATETPSKNTQKNPCQDNSLDKLAIVSINQQHMWACQGSRIVNDSPVITGITKFPETLTPPGNYQIYSKQKDVVLTGSDSTGSWNDSVQYWMPFLSNENGIYGFHDAKWRRADEFGTTDPNSENGSHGCVNLPTAFAGWLYNWAPVGTNVIVKL